ncbi:MAG: TlpA family protein disulfide reductase [Clostridiaceae bacterium]|nr:TlpA family protein disulfide reductase [Clostridiaceae bacterium]
MSIIKKKRTMLTVMCVTALLISLLSICSACQSDENNPEATEPLRTNARGHSLAPEFELVDQFGNVHRLSDYRGKIVYLTFWATWYESSSLELQDVERLYRDRAQNQGEVAVLGVVYPSEAVAEGAMSDEIREMTVEEMKLFLNEENLTFPVLFDVGGKIFGQYAITGLPTTYLIDREGFFVGVIPASIDKGLMDHFVEEALHGNNDD